MTLLEQLQQQVEALLSAASGCPWMLQQDWHSISQYTLEEAYELMDAVLRNDKHAICGELADLCLHLLIYTEFARQEGAFTWDDVVQAALDKQRQRRSSDELTSQTAQEAHALWQQKKLHHQPPRSLVDELPQHMPPLMELTKIEKLLFTLGIHEASLEEHISVLDDAYQRFLRSFKQSSSGLSVDAAHLLSSLVRAMTNTGHDINVALSEHNHQLRLRLAAFEQQVVLHHGAMADLSVDKKKSIWRSANDSG